jgi:hypothetical protein
MLAYVWRRTRDPETGAARISFLETHRHFNAPSEFGRWLRGVALFWPVEL